VAPIAAADGATVVLGVNLDDLGDHRPGQRAAAQAGAVFPLVDAGFTKQMVRDASLSMALRVVAAVQRHGYRYVTLDLEGFRSGNLNGTTTSRPEISQPEMSRPEMSRAEHVQAH